MVKSGIYEQIVNTKLQSELEELKRNEYDIELEKIDADDARKILAIYISFVLQKGLRYLRDEHGDSKDEKSKALLRQIKLCNEVIEEIYKATGDKDFEDYKILEQGEILKALFLKINNARSISNLKTVRPQTSLMESTLFTGGKKEITMLSEIKKEIVSSDSIDLLISFIKWSAIAKIINDLKTFTSREGCKLRVIATTYMKATDYKAIIELAKLPNTEVKINYETSHIRMHAKAYIFKRNTGFSTVYIGSSNLSNPALTEGLEWNIKVTEQESFDIVKKCNVTFESYWNEPSFELFNPESLEQNNRLKTELSKVNNDNKFKLLCEIRPYPYQKEILDAIEAERKVYGHRKNLLVAATGVGKTIIAAFDFKRYKDKNPNAKLLFIAHRKEILEQSVQKFREVLNDFSFGELMVDGNKPFKVDHLFMSIQSFKSSNYTKITTPDYYDFIIVDEFHHAAADSYQELLSYYEPDIFLGLTATPERMDGKDILQYFNGRIASEMRLAEAIDRKLLCPFLYFGITDSEDYRNMRWNGKYDISELENVYTNNTRRASLIIKSVYDKVADINDVKGLGFCVSVRHAKFMAEYFSKCGIPSIALSSKSEDDIRSNAKRRLVKGEVKFIFVVDLYNEGVDIPEVNTVLFLRPTESATVFLQQLGRGLRLHESKECLMVLDFIGQANKKYNYESKFKALIGRNNKSVKDNIVDGFMSMPKGCYIELEQVAQQYVLDNLKELEINKRTLVEKVKNFEFDTGKELSLENFVDYYGINLLELYRNDGSRSFRRLKIWADLLKEPLDNSDIVLKRITGILHVNSKPLLEYWIGYIKNGEAPQNENERLMRNMLYYSFFKKSPQEEGFKNIEEGIQSIISIDGIKEELIDILKYNINHIEFIPKHNNYNYECPLEVHCNYSVRQILAAFGYYDENNSPEFREGVKYFAKKKTDAFFVNLNKSEKDFSPSTMYDDYAINENLFHWQTQSGLSSNSTTANRYINHAQQGVYISLFVRKYKKSFSHTSSYVYLGNAQYVQHEGDKPISFIWHLDESIPANMIQEANKSVAI